LVKSVLFKLSVVLACVLAWALPVWAHGVIEKADPPVGGAVATAPSQVRLWLSEPVDPSFSKIAVYAAGSTERLDLGDLKLDADGALAVSLKPNLPNGVYTVEWQAFTPGDGHATTGVYSFGVGVAAGATATVATERTPLGDLVRFLSLAGECLFVGVVIFRWAIRLENEARFQSSTFWLVQATRVSLGLGTLGALYIQTQALGVSVADVLLTQWGTAWLVRAVMTAIVVVGANGLMRDARQTNGALLAGAFLLVTTSLTSHSAAKFGLLGVAVDSLHLASAAVWSGGVLCTAIAVMQGERNFLARFGLLATAAVGGVAASGLWLANGQIGSWSALLLTEYGRTLVLKLGVVAVAFGLGAVNAVLDPARLPKVWQAFARRLPVIEAVAGLGVIVVAATLTNLPPAYSQVSDGAPTEVALTKSVGDLTVALSLSPARLGVNTVEARLSDGAGQPLLARNIRLQFVPVAISSGGAIVSDLKLAEVGEGLYSASGTNFTSPGDWQVLAVVDEVQFLNFDYSIGPDAAVRAQGQPVSALAGWVAWLNRYALAGGLGLLLLGAAGWSGLAWRSLRLTAEPQVQLAMWLAPGLLLAGAVWLWIKLLS
jgi:copper transport protein